MSPVRLRTFRSRAASRVCALALLASSAPLACGRRPAPPPRDEPPHAALTQPPRPRSDTVDTFDAGAAGVEASAPRSLADAADTREDVVVSSALRAADFCNWRFVPGSMELHGCHGDMLEAAGSRGEGGYHHSQDFALGGVGYGDVTRDGREDAVVVVAATRRPLLLSMGGPTSAGRVYLFTTGDAGVVGVAVAVLPTLEGDAPVSAVAVVRGEAQVSRRATTGECVTRYRWAAGELREVPGARPCAP